MNPEIEDIYKQIGQHINQTVPAIWEEAWISVLFEPGVITSQGFYTQKQSPNLQSFRVSGDINRLFLRLRQLMSENESRKWSTAKYTLQANGTFKINFEY